MTDKTVPEPRNAESPRICDYEGSTYRTDFWEGRGRNYEDRVERQVLRRLLPAQGRRLLEVGAGFGRLTQEYRMYDEVVLLDYSFSQLQYARQQLGDDGYVYVAADAYALPFQAGVFDGATMIRVIHHFENVPNVLTGIRRSLAPQAAFILEFANKRNLKAILRHRLGRQDWHPDDPQQIEFVDLNFNFHPQTMQRDLQSAGFQMQQRVPVSFFRLGVLKNTLPTGILAGMDAVMQQTGWLVSPSIFTKNQALGETPDNLHLSAPQIFLCPQSQTPLQREGDHLVSENGLRWAIRDGIYDFKTPVS